MTQTDPQTDPCIHKPYSLFSEPATHNPVDPELYLAKLSTL
jgi:hypothetical protein